MSPEWLTATLVVKAVAAELLIHASNLEAHLICVHMCYTLSQSKQNVTWSAWLT